MEYNQICDILARTQEEIWVDKINAARLDGKLCDWATQLHPQKASCHLEGGFSNGSYNICQKIIYGDGTVSMLRLPRLRGLSVQLADEKVAMEVEALNLIRNTTTIPVPNVQAWGLAKDNPLHLGPFILMDFVSGVCLKDVIGKTDSRLIRDDVSEDDLEMIYRQMANFMIQLFNISFDKIGNVPTPYTHYSAPVRPLTYKINDLICSGGIDTFGTLTHSP